MAVIVFSPSKASVVDPQHASSCVVNTVSRLSREEQAGLTWVLMYIFLFLFYLCLSLISFTKTGFHTSISEPHMHYTIQGFTNNGFAYWTIVRVSLVALRLGSEMEPCRRDLTNILLSYLISDSFGPVLGASAWLCMTISIHLGSLRLRITSETLGKKCLKLPPGLLMFYITFLLYGSMGLTILDHIYSSLL